MTVMHLLLEPYQSTVSVQLHLSLGFIIPPIIIRLKAYGSVSTQEFICACILRTQRNGNLHVYEVQMTTNLLNM